VRAVVKLEYAGMNMKSKLIHLGRNIWEVLAVKAEIYDIMRNAIELHDFFIIDNSLAKFTEYLICHRFNTQSKKQREYL
jgi:hypothetical protein